MNITKIKSVFKSFFPNANIYNIVHVVDIAKCNQTKSYTENLI